MRRATTEVLGVLAIFASALPAAVIAVKSFPSGSIDVAHHYTLAQWYSDGPRSRSDAPSLGEMAIYPQGAHVLAAALATVVGSTFMAMHAVAIGAVALLWGGIGWLLSGLSGRRALVAAGTAVAALALTAFPIGLPLHLHGREVVNNYFFAQVVAQAGFWLSVAATAAARRRGVPRLRTAVWLSASCLLLSSIHVLPAVQTLVLLGLLAVDEAWVRWREGLRDIRALGVCVGVPTVTALALLASPGFRAMRRLAENDGVLRVPGLTSIFSVGALAAAVAASAVALLILAVRRTSAAQPERRVAEVAAAAGMAIVVPCLAQVAALVLSEGSPYGVKKHAFALLTAGLVIGCILLALAVPMRTPARRWLSPPAFATLLALAALAVTFVRPAPFRTGVVLEAEGRIAEVLSERPELRSGRAVAAGVGSGSPVFDYMFTTGLLESPRDEIALAQLTEQPLPVADGSRLLVTAADPALAPIGCRRGSPVEGLVVADLGCTQSTLASCARVNDIGAQRPLPPNALRGFSNPETSGAWTDGTSSSFHCRLSPRLVGVPLVVTVEAEAFLPPGVDRQRLMATLEGATAAFEARPGVTAARLRLETTVSDEDFHLEFTTPDAISPAEVGVSSDPRKLAFFLDRVTISPR